MLLIYIPKSSIRCDYVFRLIFKEELGIEYQATTDISTFENHLEEKINYSNSRIQNELFIKASPLIFESGIKNQEIKVEEKDGIKLLFPEDDDLGFDVFSAVFYMVSRYEEYLPFVADKFGRFKATDSLAFKNDFLKFPVVNIWINLFKILLQKKFSALKIKQSVFTAILTYDIDVAYQYRGRSFVRTVGSFIKDLLTFKIKEIPARFQTLYRQQKDPWDVYHDLNKLIVQNQLPSIFFFLLADKTAHDRNLNYQNPLMKELVNKIQLFAEIGIHPSFNTPSLPQKILLEKERLENLSLTQISKSRQHYLKFHLPGTYNSLLAAGIKEDYSMGFPDMPGFRSGTCKPFYFYDLNEERSSELKIFPVTCMDATFIYYSKKTPERSFMEILQLLKEVKKVGGTFISIFHNDHIGENADGRKWKSIHNQMIIQIKSYLKNT